MKVVAYSIKKFEKEYLAIANHKKHEITLISNGLSLDTAAYAEGKDAAVVFSNDDVSAPVIDRLADLGIKFIATRSVGTDHIDREAAARRGIRLANVPAYAPQAIAEYAVGLVLALNRKLVASVNSSRQFNFSVDQHIGFNLYGKTVGIVGLGHIGLAAAIIFKGFGCKVLACDPEVETAPEGVELVNLTTLLNQSDIISLHTPLTEDTRYIIRKESIEQMKTGVMLINTGRGALVNTQDVLQALENGRIAYLGMDVYEFEKGLFFADHQQDIHHDPILERLMAHPNVIITPHQAFLTQEALQEIANQTIRNLDNWQAEQCVGKACICTKECRIEAKLKLQTPLNPSAPELA